MQQFEFQRSREYVELNQLRRTAKIRAGSVVSLGEVRISVVAHD
jgi:ribosome-associated protein YbcJ (S4-like RNA binding protein)